MTIKHIVMVASVVLAFTAWGLAQEVTPKPVAPAVPPAPAPAATADDELAKLLDMNAEDLDKMIRKAAVTRLTGERNQVTAEIRDGVLFDPDTKDDAVKVLEDKPLNTQRDNIKRICEAFAKVDDRFGAAYKLYTDGKYDKAADAFKKIVNNKEVSYLSAARSYLMCDSLARTGFALMADPKIVADDAKNKVARKMVWDAVDGYKDLIDAMPDRLSITASAALNCAEAYDQLGRCIYAAEYYGFCVKNFAMTLDKDQLDAIQKKVEKMQEIYKDPMASVARMMGEVKDRLDKVDSGKDTRQTEAQIISILDDLIKTAQEKQQQQSKSDSKSNAKKKEKGEGDGEGEGKEGEGEGKEGKGKGKGKGKGRMTNDPSSPATESSLRDGETARPGKMSDIRDKDDKSGWAELPKSDRDKLKEVSGKIMSERYKAQIEAYFESTSSEKGK